MGILGAIGRGIAKGAKTVGHGIAKAAKKIKEKITGEKPSGGTPGPEPPEPPEPPGGGGGSSPDWADAVINGFMNEVDEVYYTFLSERPTQKQRADNYYNDVTLAVQHARSQDKYTFAESLQEEAGEIIRYFEQALYDSKEGTFYLNICLGLIREAATGQPTTVADSIQDTGSFYGEDI